MHGTSHDAPHHRRYSGIAIGLAAVIAILAMAGFVRVLPALMSIPAQMDFSYYYNAARALNERTPIYTPFRRAEAQLATAGEASDDVIYLGYIYPPVVAVLLRPLALIPFAAARLIWYALNLALVPATLLLVCRSMRIARGINVAALSLAALVFPPTYDTLLFGQINILLLFLIVVALYCITLPPTTARELLAGVALGLAVSIKLFPLVFAIMLLTRWRFTALVSMLVAIGGFALLGIALGGGWENSWLYLRQVLPGIAGSTAFPVNQSAQAVIARLFAVNTFRFPVLTAENYVIVTVNPAIDAPSLGVALSYLVRGSVGIATAAALIRLYHVPRKDAAPLDAALLATMFLLVNPIAWDYYAVLMLLPFAVLWKLRTVESSMLVVVLLISMLLLVLQRYWRILSQIVLSPWLMMFGFAGVLVAWAALVYLAIWKPWPPVQAVADHE